MAKLSHDERWKLHVESVWRHIRTHGSAPSQLSGDLEERRLARWMLRQSRLLKSGSLSAWRAAELGKLTPLDTGATPKWGESFADLKLFVSTNGRLPSTKAPTKAEALMYQWMVRQRVKLRMGELDEDPQIEEFREIISSNPSQLHRRLTQDVQAFTSRHGRLPSPQTEGYLERAYGVWIEAQRASASAGTLGDHMAARLDDQLPGWRTPTPAPEGPVDNPKQRAQAVIDRLADELSVVEAIDGGRRSAILAPHAWLVSHHLGELPEPPSAEQVQALEEHLGRNVDLGIELPLTRLAKATKKSEQVSARDYAWCDRAVKAAEYRLNRGRWPKQVGDRKAYRGTFDRERAKPEPRRDILAQEISDEVIDLGYWLREQRRLDMLGQIREDRALFLDAIAPDWRVRKFRRKSFDENLLEVASFVQQNAHWPSQYAVKNNPWEKNQAGLKREVHFAHVLKKWRTDFRKGILPVSQTMELERLFGGNWHIARLPPLQPPVAAVEEFLERLKQAATD